MNLKALRTEVEGHGFDDGVYGLRINAYINDAYNLACRRAVYYTNEATMDFGTVAGIALYPQPVDLARDRSLRRTDRPGELGQVDLRDIDRAPVASGGPRYYALDGGNLHLYPIPDGVYPIELRYWKVPAPLVQDTDSPTIPDTYQRLLWYWACKECYAADDDPSQAQYWEQQFNLVMSEFQADMKFPTDDSVDRISSMWDTGRASGGYWRIAGS